MFRLKRLELLGFKSFADRTRLEFGPGTVGVVGPNGCGKSNLADAINWVLGEQSPRLLRGERMTDVIFNGTGSRLPTGMAEVSLTLEDPEYTQVEAASETCPSSTPSLVSESEESAPAQENKDGASEEGSLATGVKRYQGVITVTRRLFRSGESEYLINGELSRLRDIQDIFMGTGLGPESYAIIEQGRIGQILSSRPSDRRLILEEAAGISKFKARKRAAELKLESSRQNLARITDILEEVTKQLGSLKRQASKARRFRELREQLDERLKITLLSRLKALEGECARRREELDRCRAAWEQAARTLEELELERKAAAAQDDALESQLTELRQAAAQAELDKQRLASEVEQMRQQWASLGARAEDASLEIQRLSEKRGSLEAQARQMAERQLSLERERTSVQQEVRRLSELQETVGARIRQAEETLEASRAAMLEALSAAATLRNQLVQLEESDLAMERQVSRLASERTQAESERRRLAGELDLLISELQSCESEDASLRDLQTSVAEQLSAARQTASEWQAKLDSLRQVYSAAVGRQQALEEALSRHAYSRESVRRLLTGEIQSNGHRFRPLGVLADFMEVNPGYEEVVEEFLDSHLDCVVVEDTDEARSGIALLRQEGAGRSTFFVTRFPSNGHGHASALNHEAVRREDGVRASVRELVRFAPQLGLSDDLPLASLATAYLVEDSATAERLAVAYPDCHFLTPEGDHYHHRTVSGGRGKNAGPLALRRDFRELERRIAELSDDLKNAEAARAESEARAKALSQEWERLTASKFEAEKAVARLNEKIRQVREGLERASERHHLLESEGAALTADRAALESRREELRAALAVATAEKDRHEDLSNQRSAELRDLRASFEATSQELARTQAAASAQEERARSLEGEQQRLEMEIRESAERASQLARQVEAWRAEQSRLAGEIGRSEEQCARLEDEHRRSSARVRELAEQAASVRARRDEYALRVESARSRVEAQAAQRSEAEIASARAESDRDHHLAQCRETLRENLDAWLAALDPGAVLKGEALEAAEEEARELRRRIESLGPLNMMALEELQEAEERYAFLEGQRQDLLTSIEETTEAVRQIDRLSRQQFLEAFKAINANFAETFQTLFGGGMGQMRLTDENDPESGLDIVAQPPGKRLQNVLLLSGGEKALAALALLMAIFRYTPSPFCILDEVDAPLDESNVERFTRLIRSMSVQTQFILITHNKRTMEITDALYGVTMEEPGVSKLVSVRFEEAAAA